MVKNWLLVFLGLLWACSSPTRHETLIPKDAIVLVIDLPQMMQKVQWALLKDFLKEQRIWNKLQFNELPIDLTYPCFFAFLPEEKLFAFVLKDPNNIEEALKTLLEKHHWKYKPLTIKNTDKSFQLLPSKINGDNLFIFACKDKQAMLVLGKAPLNALKRRIAKYFRLPSKEQWITQEAAQAFYKERGDISMWVPASIAKKLEEISPIWKMERPLIMHLYFEAGKIRMKSYATEPPMEGLLEKTPATIALKALPEKTLFVLSMAAPVEKLYTLFKERIPAVLEEWETTMQTQLDISFKKFFYSLEGTFLMSVHGIKWYEKEPLPIISAAISLKKSKEIRKIFKKLGLKPDDKGIYTIISEQIEFYFILRKQFFFFTMSKNLASHIAQGKLPLKSLADSPLGPWIAQHPFALYLAEEAQIKKLLYSYDPALTYPQSISDLLEAIRIYTTKDGEVFIEILLSRKDKNSLYWLLKILEEETQTPV